MTRGRDGIRIVAVLSLGVPAAAGPRVGLAAAPPPAEWPTLEALGPSAVPVPRVAASLCAIARPASAPPSQQGKENDEPTKRPVGGDRVTPPARWNAVIAEWRAAKDPAVREQKGNEAGAILLAWWKERLRTLGSSGSARAKLAEPEHPPEVKEILNIDKFVQVNYTGGTAAAETAGLRGNKGISEANAIYSLWGSLRMKQVLKDGLEQAKRGLPTPPEEVRTALSISKQAQLVGLTSGWVVAGLDVAREILATWAGARLPDLRLDGFDAADANPPKPPKEVAEAYGIDRDLNALNVSPPGRYTPQEVANDIMERWVDVRLKKLRDTGIPAAEKGSAQPPTEVEQLVSLQQEVPGSMFPAARRRVDGNLARMATTWTDARLKLLREQGEPLAAAGQSTTPPQVAQIVEFGKENNCLGMEEEKLAERAGQMARALGERNLETVRGKLSCPVAERDKAVVRGLIADLRRRGWGPYSESFGCGWSGTIRYTFVTSEDTSVSGGGSTETRRVLDSMLVVLDLDGEKARASVSGLVRERRTATGTGCNNRGSSEVSRDGGYAGGGEVPVRVEPRSNRYWVQFTVPAAARTAQFRGKFKHGCSFGDAPEKPREESRTEKTDLLPASQAFLTDPIPPSQLATSKTLTGEQKQAIGGSSRTQMIIRWELRRP